MSATTGSRYRGRQTRGGRIVLRCADGCSELVLEEWELQRLVRGLSQDLDRALRPGRSLRGPQTCLELQVALAGQPAGGFFRDCAAHGGFMASRS